MLMELAEIFRRNAGKPQRINVDDANSVINYVVTPSIYSVSPHHEHNLPLLNEAWASLLDSFMNY